MNQLIKHLLILLLIPTLLLGFGSKPKKNITSSLKHIHKNEIKSLNDSLFILSESLIDNRAKINYLIKINSQYLKDNQVDKAILISEIISKDKSLDENKYQLNIELVKELYNINDSKKMFRVINNITNEEEKVYVFTKLIEFFLNENDEINANYLNEKIQKDNKSEINTNYALYYSKKGNINMANNHLRLIKDKDLKDHTIINLNKTNLLNDQFNIVKNYINEIQSLNVRNDEYRKLALRYSKVKKLKEAIEILQNIEDKKIENELIFDIALKAHSLEDYKSVDVLKDIIDDKMLLSSLHLEFLKNYLVKRNITSAEKELDLISNGNDKNLGIQEIILFKINEGYLTEAFDYFNKLSNIEAKNKAFLRLAPYFGNFNQFNLITNMLINEIKNLEIFNQVYSKFLLSYAKSGDYINVIKGLDNIIDDTVKNNTIIKLVKVFLENEKKASALSILNIAKTPEVKTQGWIEMGKYSLKSGGVLADLAQAHFLYALDSCLPIPKSINKVLLLIEIDAFFNKINFNNKNEVIKINILNSLQKVSYVSILNSDLKIILEYLVSKGLYVNALQIIKTFEPSDRIDLLTYINTKPHYLNIEELALIKEIIQ